MVRTLIGILLLVFAGGLGFVNNRTDCPPSCQPEWIAFVVCLLLAAVLLLWNPLAALLHKKETAEKIPQECNTMTFTLPAFRLKVGQQLYLRPLTWENNRSKSLSPTNRDNRLVLFRQSIPNYVLSCIESQRPT